MNTYKIEAEYYKILFFMIICDIKLWRNLYFALIHLQLQYRNECRRGANIASLKPLKITQKSYILVILSTK